MRFLLMLISRVSLLGGLSLLLLNPAHATQETIQNLDASLRSPRTLKEANLTAQDLTPLLPTQPTAVEPTPADAGTPADSSSSTFTYRPLPPQVGASFTTGPGVGYESSFGSIEGFVPLVQTPGKEIGYVQGRLNLDTAADPGGNLLLGYRAFNPATNTVLGGYLGFDIRSTGNQTVSQLGAGIEAILPAVELRLNGYLPVGNRSREIASSSVFTDSITATSSAPRFQGNFLVVGGQSLRTTQTTRLFEDSLAGFDAEAGVKVARWSPVGTLKSYLGLYYYGSPRVDGFVGVRGRLEARINENFRAGLSIQGDREFGTTAAVSVAFSFPGIGSSSTAPQQLAWAEAGNFVFRQSTVAVTQRRTTDIATASTGTGIIALLNPATNQPWFFQHVALGGAAGSGTFEAPFSTVESGLAATRGDRNDIVYVQAGSNPGIPAFTIPANVQVLSAGITQQIQTVQQGLTPLPLSGSGILPGVTGTVTLGNNTTLAGFNITPPIGNVGILANGVQDITIRQNQVAVAGGSTNGIQLQNVTSTATVIGNTVATNSFESNGIFISSNANSAITTATVSDNIITTTGNFARGIFIVPNNSAIATLTVSGNTITTSGDFADGIALLLDNNSSITTATISGNTVTTTGADANGINTELQGGSSIASFRLTNNQIPQSGLNNVRIANFGGQTICAAIQGNLAQNPGAGGVNFDLLSGFPLVVLFRVIDLPNLNTNNNGGTFQYDFVGLPTANYVNVASCP
ncbi:right-handed parallel beta-helix repeat-containing protein [Leptolyngbyaceae cyanobacterium UHCC 1019]